MSDSEIPATSWAVWAWQAYRDGRLVEAHRIEELEAKIRTYEQRDGMDGAVVSAIRDLLNHHNVPKAAFIDDHVCNAIRQRNIAEAKLAELEVDTQHLLGVLERVQSHTG